MYCSNCGKEIKETDNFCRFCGFDLRSNAVVCDEHFETEEENEPENKPENEQEKNDFVYEGEELVLYDVKKHVMALFWTIFLTPLFLVYFWAVFLSSHSIFSWIIVLGMLALIIYPAMCFKSDKIVITTKSAHIKIGVLNPAEIEIPIENFNMIDVTQTSMGRMLDYGTITFHYNSEKYDYPYVKSPEELLYIFKNPKEFIEEELKEED